MYDMHGVYVCSYKIIEIGLTLTIKLCLNYIFHFLNKFVERYIVLRQLPIVMCESTIVSRDDYRTIRMKISILSLWLVHVSLTKKEDK